MGTEWWNKRETLFRFLKKYTSKGSDARKMVQSTNEDNGWEAWQKINMQYEPAIVMKEAVAMAQFTGMVTKRAKNPAETRNMMVDFEEKARKVQEITGEAVNNTHAMSVLVGIVDAETLKYTAQFQGAKASVDELKRKSWSSRV